MYRVLMRTFGQRFWLSILFFIFTFQFFDSVAVGEPNCGDFVSRPPSIILTPDVPGAFESIMTRTAVEIAKVLSDAGIFNHLLITAQIIGLNKQDLNKLETIEALNEALKAISIRFQVIHTQELSSQAQMVIEYYLLNVVKAMLTPKGTLDQVPILTLNDLWEILQARTGAKGIGEILDKLKAAITIEKYFPVGFEFKLFSLPSMGIKEILGEKVALEKYINWVLSQSGDIIKGPATTVGTVLRPQHTPSGGVAYTVVSTTFATKKISTEEEK